MVTPFDPEKLNRLLGEAGVALALVNTRHNVRYLLGGHFYHFHANSSRMGLSQYLPLLGIPRDRVPESFYVGRAEERAQIDSCGGIWVPEFVEALRGTTTAALGAIDAIRRLGLRNERIGVEMPFLPADVYLTLKEGLPGASFVDITPAMDSLRTVKSEDELKIIRRVYSNTADAIHETFAASRRGQTTAEIASRVELEMTARNVTFLFALVCAGPGFLRAPSSVRWENGRILHIDAGGTERDYIADICRMGCIGEPPALARELHAACLEVQNHVRSLVRRGASCRSLMAEGQKASQAYSFSEYARFVIHGIGMVPYEQPLFTGPVDQVLESGMVLSIETDFLHPEVGHVKIEDAVAVTDSGCEGLGDRGREWQIVG